MTYKSLRCTHTKETWSLELTTMKIAIIIATPSTHSTGGESAGRGVPKSWNRPSASEMTAAIESKICEPRI
jgi:hypothetical protein